MDCQARATREHHEKVGNFCELLKLDSCDCSGLDKKANWLSRDIHNKIIHIML